MQLLDPVFVTDVLPEERRRLLDLLAGLSDAQWHTPTICAGWSVKDLVQHLLGDDLGVLSRQRDGFVDRSLIEPDSDLGNWHELVAFINRINGLWVQATRRLSPQLLCTLLQLTGQALVDYYTSLDPQALGGAVSWAGPEPAPIWLDIAREYTERWVHQQQIRDALQLPGLKERRLFAPVLATFIRALPHTLRDTPAPNGTSLQLTITGEAGGTWHAVRHPAGWVLAAGPAAAPNAATALDQETAWRLCTKGITKADAFLRTTFTGDSALAERVLDMVSIIA